MPEAHPGPAPARAVAAPVAWQYGGFWRRFFAFVIDYAIATVVAFFFVGAVSSSPGAASVASLAAWWGYFCLSNSLGQMAGKAVLGVKVIDPTTGGPPGLGKGTCAP